MRWKWFHNKHKDPNTIEDDYSPKPWTKRSERRAPIASDAPELEAFFAAVERDMKNPDLRKNVKSNLNEEQRKFINEVQSEYPERGLRVRTQCGAASFFSETNMSQLSEHASQSVCLYILLLLASYERCLTYLMLFYFRYVDIINRK